MSKPTADEYQSRSTARRDDLTPAKKRELEHLRYWESSIFAVEDASASVIDGLAVPVVGGLLDLSLDQSFETIIAMMQHPDPDLRWSTDTALVIDGRIIAVVRSTPRGADVTRFDVTAALPAERVKPGRRASRRSTITWIDGSLHSTAYGLGILLAGRDLADALDAAIRSICDGLEDDDTKVDLDDVALSYRGHFVAVIRFTLGAPAVTRFDLPDSPSGGAADPSEDPEQPAFPVVEGGQDRTRQSTVEPPPTSHPGAIH